ncbi:MAG: ZIP family metal transporter [Candidatus Pacebacteria bacterium]|nr:ZIP family metal transporter [Candidatus Paceibacterota bacterium]
MTTTYLYTFGSVITVSLISLIGIFTLSLKAEILRKYTFVFISIAVGALLGDAFIHLIPEAFEGSLNTTLSSILIVGGVLLFFILEKFFHWHHHGEDTEEPVIHPVGKLVLFSDGFHNFMDGIIIAASFSVSVPLGLATTLAVILHEIPQEIGDFAVLVHSGYTKSRALWLNFLSALLAVFGAIIFFILGDIATISSYWFLPVAAGGFIYIALADLIPELNKTNGAKHSIAQISAVIIGVLFMVALTCLE